MSITAHGGVGNDRVWGSLTFLDSYWPFHGSTGWLDANLDGDGDNDSLDLTVFEEVPGSLQFTDDEAPFIDGGAGTDGYGFYTSTLVAKKNMEKYLTYHVEATLPYQPVYL